MDDNSIDFSPETLQRLECYWQTQTRKYIYYYENWINYLLQFAKYNTERLFVIRNKTNMQAFHMEWLLLKRYFKTVLKNSSLDFDGVNFRLKLSNLDQKKITQYQKNNACCSNIDVWNISFRNSRFNVQ